MAKVDRAPADVERDEQLERLYREQGAKMWRAVLAFAGDPEVADDAVAEGFAQALHRRLPARRALRAAVASRVSVVEPEARLGLVILAVNDRAWALRFYQEAFGWPLLIDAPGYAELELPAGMRLGLYDRRAFGRNLGRTPPAPMEGTLSRSKLYLSVADLDEAVTRVRRAGAPLLSGPAPRDWGDRVAYLADPDGNVVALAQPTDETFSG
jgi:lactoylglutathione lyase